MFADFGYRQALRGLGEYESADSIRQRLRFWCRDESIGDDLLVVYFAGHGVVDDRHYLMCWDTDPDDPAGTALPTEELVRVLVNGGVRHLLLIIDTCYGGAGAAEAGQIALRRVAKALSGDQWTNLWFLTSARSQEPAYDKAFAKALPAALTAVTGRSGQRQEAAAARHRPGDPAPGRGPRSGPVSRSRSRSRGIPCTSTTSWRAAWPAETCSAWPVKTARCGSGI